MPTEMVSGRIALREFLPLVVYIIHVRCGSVLTDTGGVDAYSSELA